MLKTYINREGTAVLTDYAIQPVRVLAGTLPGGASTPGTAIPLRLNIFGGEVTRDGVTIRAENHNLNGALSTTASYLLFLRRSNSPGVYTLYNVGAFELSDRVVQPAARRGNELYKNLPRTYGDVVAQVTSAARGK